VIRSPRRDALREHHAAHRIGTEVYYPVPLHLQPCFASLGYGPGDCPVAESAAAETLALPIHPDLAPGHVDAVVAAIADFHR
jgi:UDP-2-acetamido-2-deoxy-ribo-hexuluronate aminotransferase